MRLATVYPPQNGERNVLLERDNQTRLIPLAHLTPLVVLIALVGCALAWIVFALSSSGSRAAVVGPERSRSFSYSDATPASQPRVATEISRAARSRVRPFDASQSLKRGDTVVVHQDGKSTVRQIAATSMEPVLLKRGNVVQGFYLAGEGSYVVTSGDEMKVVRPEEIFATVEPFDARAK